MPTDQISITTVFYVPETSQYGFRRHFEGHPPHHVIDTCETLQDALAGCDPHREHDWEEASDADENALLVSRGYKEGSVMWRMTHFTVAELVRHRSMAT